MRINPMLMTDFYKISHRIMSEEGTEKIYSTFTPRGSRIEGIDEVVFFGLQGMIKDYLIEYFNDNFFNLPKEEVVNDYKRTIKYTLGDNCCGTNHIEDLHDLGYLPIKIMAIPEGTRVPMRVPVFTIENTDKRFYWLTNFLETSISAEIWKVITATTIAGQYRDICEKWADKTADSHDHINWQCHNFSMRGMGNCRDAITTGAGHLLFGTGTDTIPAIQYLEHYYNANIEKELVASSVLATEHSIQCQYGDDYKYYKRMLTEVAPTGIISIVSDGYDYWNVIGSVIPSLKDVILDRGGKLVVRPDCYDEQTKILTDSGWKYFDNLLSDDRVAQVLDDGTYEFVKPLKYVKQEYKGDMYRFFDQKRKLDLLVTPNHRMIFKINNEWKVETAEKVKLGYYKKRMVRSAKAQSKNKQLTPIERVKIAFQADGSYISNGTNGIRFSFSKQRKIERCKEILNKANMEYSEYNLADGKTELNIKCNTGDFQKDFNWVDTSDLCSDWSKDFIEELSYWDATRRSDTRFKFDTTVKEVIDKVELIALSAGYGVLISRREDKRKECFSDVYTAHILKNNELGGQSQQKEKVEYDGNVYCVQVPTGRLIVKRNDCVMVCGNSGDPVKIICGDRNSTEGLVRKGSVECLWDIFGGHINNKGYKVLNPHIGLIYGDAITPERAEEIFKQLEAKGFSAENVTYGVGSYSLGYTTRDTFMFALKATYTIINGEEKFLFKDPKTDDGVKKSQKGKVAVIKTEDGIKYIDELNEEQYSKVENNLLEVVFKDGELIRDDSLSNIRERVKRENK